MDERREQILSMPERQFREFVDDQLRNGERRFDEHQQALAENTALTQQIASNTTEMVEIFKGAKTGASAFAWCGRNLRKFVQFIYPFALLAGVIAAILHGKWPKWGE